MTKQSTAGHTELPWSLGETGRSIIREVPGLADGYDHFMIAVASAHSLVSVEESKANAHLIVTAVNTYPAINELVEALEALANAKAISGVRSLVAGWNGEGRDEPYKERHPHRLGATLPKTCCGDVYALDEAMQKARSALTHYRELAGTSNEGAK